MRRAETDLLKDKVEVTLDGGQILYLFFGGAVIACLVFVLGVLVGRRVEARAQMAEGSATSAALDPLAALDELDRSEEELVFSRVLAGGEEDLMAPLDRAVAGEPQAKPTLEPIAPPAPRLQPAAAIETAPSHRGGKDGKASVGADVATPRPTTPAAPKAAATKAAPEDKEAKFTLQLSAFRDRGEAEVFMDQLRGDGYEPYLAETDVAGKGTLYRIRLGAYASYSDAIEAKKVFEKREHIIAYVTRLRP